jgi:serine-type D-Ala-D-Ala carboxypeptidase/endopeptidase (penicillin-binding protein 4)
MQKRFFYIFVISTVVLVACSPARRFSKARQSLLKDTALAGAHAGISIYDPAINKYLYNYQGDHYFVPASNTKLFTCYAAMKYLGDSLVGARYRFENPEFCIEPSGDPTFLHPDFIYQPLFKLMRETGKEINVIPTEDVIRYGPGWSWDDYEADYMPERSAFPVCGNTIWIKKVNDTTPIIDKNLIVDTPMQLGNTGVLVTVKPSFFINSLGSEHPSDDKFIISRDITENHFTTKEAKNKFDHQEIPFITDGRAPDNSTDPTALKVLRELISKKVEFSHCPYNPNKTEPSFTILHSQPTDSLLKPMMYRSDNFFAEQSLLMVSNEKLGFMSDQAIIDTLLQNDLKDLPQKPTWVDGSGLSRYNLFTPQDIIAVLLKIKNEFGLERIKNILPKGNTGTLTAYYQPIGTSIFAKTGSLSGVVALSGYLQCKSGKQLLFSVLVNNHNSSGRAVRRAVEKFVTNVWEKN